MKGKRIKIVVYLTSLRVNWTFFGMSGPHLHTNELNITFFCSTSLLKAQNSLKICKISLTFRFDKL
jgi:hypothetical protein